MAIRIKVSAEHRFGAEGYRLEVEPTGITIESSTDAGAFYAAQTLRQLLPPSLEQGKWPHDGVLLPGLKITDEPKFKWRGLHLDVSRHFFDVAFVKRCLDMMALMKLNTFHWHLVDDGGWRVEIKKYPELTRRGAFRALMEPMWAQKELRFPEPGTEPTYGGFYTQDEVRDVVAYAAARHITVVPEIEMPGHTQPVAWCYPELMCEGGNEAAFRERTGNQRSNVYCAGKEETFGFIEDVLSEVLGLFPSSFIHIGGDEVDKFLWERCPRCQSRMASEGLKDTRELQSYFVKRVERWLAAKGRSLVGWDEILEGGLAPGATVMSWRGVSGGIEAAKSGHEVVMSPTSHCYFDYSYQAISTQTAFSFNPIPEDLSYLEGKYVLGGQANLWTEWIADNAKAEQMIFPRILGLTEALWNGSPDRNFEEFQGRLRHFLPRLDALGVNYYVPVPQAEFDAVVLDGSARVSFKEPPVAGGIIRYTLDGTLPTAKSPAYGAPIAVDRPLTVTAALFLSGGQKSDPVRVAVASRPASVPSSLEAGVMRRSTRAKFEKLPDFDKLRSTIDVARVPDLSLAEFDDTEEFALEFTGFLRIEKEGVYTLYSNSDDGSAIDICGARVVDNDGLHGPVEKSGRIRLKPGLYPIRILMFEAGGGDVLEVSIEGPGMAKTPLTGLQREAGGS